MNNQTTRDDHAYEVFIFQRELERIQKEITDNMLLNSTLNHTDNSNSSRQPLLLNTSSLNGENLEDCIAISKEIERQEQLRQFHRRLSHPTPLEATMTHEEIYECSFEDDRFHSALEYQNSVGPRQVTDLDLSQSFGDAMKYFDEEVDVDSGQSRCDTPNKLPANGTVAAVVANFQTQMSKSLGSPPPPYQEHASPQASIERAEREKHTSTIQELRKKYEQSLVEEQKTKPQEKARKSKDHRRSAPPVLPAPTPIGQKSPKSSRKSKVKQIAHMFNAKISQLMRRDSTEKEGYSHLENSQSLNTKPSKKPVVMKPVPKVRSRLPIYRNGLPSPVPSPRFKHRLTNSTSSQPLSDSESACLVAEDVFRQLSVKDKALLYNKFIEDMSKQHPQFSVHARVVEANVQQELARSEKAERPVKVKELAAELEAKLNVAKPKISPWALKRLASLQKSPEYDAANSRISPTVPPSIAAAIRSLEEEEEQANQEVDAAEEGVDTEELHVSTLTIVLKPNEGCGSLSKQREVPRPLPRKAREMQFINDMRIIERSQKRNNDSMRASVSFEAYGPPKKIRRTRAERLQPKTIFQNAHMERLFYNWIMEKNGVTFDITTVENSEDSLCGNGDEANTSKSSIKSKSKVHVLLEKAIAKLESVEARVMRRDSSGGKKLEKTVKIIKETREQHYADKSVIEVELLNSKTGTSSDEMKREPTKRTQRKVKRQAPQPPMSAKNHEQANEQELSSLTPSSKQSEAESESGLSSLPKITSDESHPEQTAPPSKTNKTADFEFTKPNKTPRKKKLRRTLTWKKENCIIESRFIPSSTDSESDHKTRENREEVLYDNVGQNLKKCLLSSQVSTEIYQMATAAQQAVNQEQQKSKMDETLLNNINSTENIRSVYTLTAMSTPSTYTESETSPVAESDPELISKREMLQTSFSSPSIVRELMQANKTTEKSSTEELSKIKEASKETIKPEEKIQKLIDSFVDLGFETGSNGMESPKRRVTPVPTPRRSKGAAPLFIKLTPDLDKTLQQNRSSFSSTPIKGLPNLPQQAFNSNIARHLQQQQQPISPVGTLNGGRRRSIQADDSRRNSIAMQVICEDRPLGKVERSETPCSSTVTDTSFFGNSFNLNVTSNTEQLERSSKFWISVGDFTICLDVFYNPPDRLSLLNDIFSQKSSETRDLHFGVDDKKFSTHNPADKADISTRLPTVNGCSHYWFSTGDLAVPFIGKYLAPEKVERLFKFIKDSMSDKTLLRFGVDDYEFSSVPENWQSSPKFSMESSYSMLVGLQGSSNGLEGRSRFAWPSSVYDSANSNSNSNSIKTSDLDYSEFGSEFDNSEIRNLTESPCGSNYFDVASENNDEMILPRNSNASMCDKFFNAKFDIESLDKLFEDDLKERSWSPSISDMLQKLQHQKVKLKALEKRMKTYSNHSSIADATIPHSKESPQYMQKLRIIISAIDNIGRDNNGFKACSMKQLESFVYFLTRYADLCLSSCDKHMNRVLDALLDQQQQQQQELIQSNNEMGVA